MTAQPLHGSGGVIKHLGRFALATHLGQQLLFLHLIRLLGALGGANAEPLEQLHVAVLVRVGSGQQLAAVEDGVGPGHKTHGLHLLIHLLPPG